MRNVVDILLELSRDQLEGSSWSAAQCALGVARMEAPTSHARPKGFAPKDYPNWDAAEGVWRNAEGTARPSKWRKVEDSSFLKGIIPDEKRYIGLKIRNTSTDKVDIRYP